MLWNRHTLRGLCVSIALLALVACESPGGVRGTTPVARTKAPDDPTEAVVQANTEFGIDLYQRLGKDDSENLFFSPYSVSSALAMTWAGAAGETADEMAEVLHFPENDRTVHEGFDAVAELHALGDEAGGPSELIQLNVANALWGQEGWPFRTDYLDLTRRYYRAGLRKVDFEADIEKARNRINQWVADMTAGRIENLIPPGAIDARTTRLVLTNAIYFKAPWTNSFEESNTRPEPFQVSRRKVVRAPLMYQQEEFLYFEEEDAQVLEMPYGTGDASMVVVLPREVDGLGAIEKSLSAERLLGWQGMMSRMYVNVWLPRFKLTQTVGLADRLRAMGMHRAFSPESADFSALSERPGLFISAVLHKAFVEVTEEGTEAAAATAAVMSKGSFEPVDRQPPDFRADRPFLFYIRDNRSGAILFMGRLIDPTAGESPS